MKKLLSSELRYAKGVAILYEQLIGIAALFKAPSKSTSLL